MAIPSRGHYGVAEDIIYSFPVTTKDGAVTVVEDLEVSDFIREKMSSSERELLDERSAVENLL